MADLDVVWFARGLPEHLVELTADLRCCGPDESDLVTARAAVAGGEPYTAETFDRAPGLRVVARVGIGVDAVDLEAASERGVMVTNTPEGPTTSTAEHTIALMMAVAKELTVSAQRLRRSEGRYIERNAGMELAGRTLGLVGFGRIGQAVARIAEAIGMQVIVTDPASDRGTDLDIVLSNADIVSLHVPATEDSIGMIDAEALARMKRGSILINCARGPVVDTDALVAALESGHLMAAGLDVTDPEPLPPDHPLLHMENVVVTPHVASSTLAGRERMEQMALEQVRMALAGRRPTNLVNTDVWTGEET